MMKGNSSAFQGTPEQEAKLKEVIESRKSMPGCLMPVLQEAQAIYGYLPIEVQKMIAEGLGVSLSEVYGSGNFLHAVFAYAQRQAQNQSLPRHGMLCQRRG